MKIKQIIPILGIIIAIAVLAIPFSIAYADDEVPGIGDETCLSCHDFPGMRTTLASGEVLFTAIDSVTHVTSVHGRSGIACVQCHTDIDGYPHREIPAATVREYTLAMYGLCERCHASNYEASLDSTHQRALADGHLEAAVCTDCHGTHNIQEPETPRSNKPKMCERCHSTIFTAYQNSVHGADLIGEGNPDVPTCTDCHGVHNVQGPSTAETFHLFSPQICADCHDDKILMDRYDVSTDVFDSYVADFHGTTVVLFEKIAPDQETNKPVCIDCHGVHDMRKVDDPESYVIKKNLLDTCQKCHPSASVNFPTSWLSHYKPSPEEHPLVYFVDLFYRIIIPVTLGGMSVFIGADIFGKISKKRGGEQ
ncbi:MAG: cytochrome c3 family protein [Anaerolineales bacterium]|nr:cytochrome c3 family protein [Chloroflexota bacterium]MBL6979944.1 cytochrome c3 family protein [Anaerolineales bacterium]